MSDFTGIGSYEIVPLINQGMSLNVWGGGVSSAGTQIKLFPRLGHPNTGFYFSPTGVQPNEYHIVAELAGLMVNSTANGITVAQVDPKQPWSRWVLNAVGNGAYYINNADGKTQMNVKGAVSTTGTPIIPWPFSTAANAQFYLKKMIAV